MVIVSESIPVYDGVLGHRDILKDSHFINTLERVEANEKFSRSELRRVAELYPNMAIDYVCRHGNDASMELEDFLPAIWKMTKHHWDVIRICPFLYRKHPLNEEMTLLMRKAIHMHDVELYNHILELGMDPFDENNEWYSHFSKKIRKQACHIRN